jgi:hypothetical protein
MRTEQWVEIIENSGGKNENVDVLRFYWSDEQKDYKEVRNRIAKELREDNWTVRITTTESGAFEDGKYCARIEAIRPFFK